MVVLYHLLLALINGIAYEWSFTLICTLNSSTYKSAICL